jgi:hypothetical protein
VTVSPLAGRRLRDQAGPARRHVQVAFGVSSTLVGSVDPLLYAARRGRTVDR